MANDEFIKIPKYFLIAGGFWPFKITNNPVYAKIYSFYSRFQTISYMCFILSLAINLCILVAKHDQPGRIFSAINVFIIVFETCVKILLFKFKQIPDMCSHIMQNEETLQQSQDPKIKEYYQAQVNYCRIINAWQSLATIFSCTSFTAMYLWQVFAAEEMSIFKKQPFMSDMWYPFKRETNMNLVILINLGVVTQGVLLNTATQTTFVSLMLYASTRFKILQMRFEKFDRMVDEKYHGDALCVVKRLIEEHQLLIRFVTSLNERTKYVMLMDFMLNSVSLASGTIQLVVGDTVSALLSVFLIVIMVLLQIFLLAWSANEISVESVGVADALCASNWNEQSEEIQKLFVIMIMRAQKPLGITAGPFFQVNTRTALATVKIAYSYLSLMMQNYED